MTLAEENDVLRERVAWLEGELGLVRDAERRMHLRRALRVTPQEAQILLALESAYPRPVQKWALEEMLPTHWRSGEQSNFITVHIAHLRTKIGKTMIATETRAYRLTPAGVEKVRAALASQPFGKAA